MKKIAYLLAFILCNVIALKALDTKEIPQLQMRPPSPDAAALGKYGKYPVSMCNGLVQIDIPIYTVDLPMLKLPVSISYHASGIKVDEISSTVGLGWVLNAGGVITRSVNGLPDYPPESQFYPMTRGKQWIIKNLFGDDKINYLNNLYNNDNGSIDSETDTYYYNVCGMSGSFRLNTDGQVVQIPLTDNIISYDGMMFQITGNDGTVYTFMEKETSVFVNKYSSSSDYTSSWYLSTIKTIDNREISFDYQEDITPYMEQYISYSMKRPHNPPYGDNIVPAVSNVELKKTQLLKSITFQGGVIRFSYQGDRADRRKYRLTSVDIKNSQNLLIKSFSLEHGYFTPSGAVPVNQIPVNGNYRTHYDYRLKLNKLLLLDDSRAVISDYSFDYNTTALLPAYLDALDAESNPGANRIYFGQDLWGYFNGVSSNKDFFAYSQFYSIDKPQADREVSPFHAQACMLKKIVYPTKGYTEFEYESNRYASGNLCGGLRIKNIKSYPSENSAPMVKSYQYEQGVSNMTGWHKVLGTCYTQGQVKEITYDNNGLATTKVELFDFYLSQPSFPLSHSGGTSVFYPRVTEFEGSLEENNGKTEYSFLYYLNDVEYFSLFPCVFPSKLSLRYEYLFIDRGWTRGFLTDTRTYKKNNGVFLPVTHTKYDYQALKKDTVRVGFKSFANYGTTNRPMVIVPFGPNVNTLEANELFQYTDLIAETGLIRLVQVRDTSFFDNGNYVAQLTNHFYDRLNNQYEITATHQVNSDGSIIKKSFTYPKDINSIMYKSMANRIGRYNHWGKHVPVGH